MLKDVSTIYSCVLELPERERVILIEYYGLEGDALTLKQITFRHNITREQARALKARAEWRIRRRIKATLVL
jgi:DNA-directed RNA polymerase sigma subunit (sigma70/sigma32)